MNLNIHMTDMQICVLSDSELNEFGPSQYMNAYSWDIIIPQKPVNEFIRAIDDDVNYDVYFNLCDGADNPDEDYNGIDIVRALEDLQLPFTGANSRFYDPSREEMQPRRSGSSICVPACRIDPAARFLDRIFRSALIRKQTEIQTSALKRGE
jgi:hypothetical protein